MCAYQQGMAVHNAVRGSIISFMVGTMIGANNETCGKRVLGLKEFRTVALLLILSATLLVGFAVEAEADTPIQQVLPFNRPRISDLRASSRKAFAYWHVWPVSVDNLDPSVDWYQRNELSPLGNSGAYYAVGGRMRQRPLPRPIRSEPAGTWQVRDMEDELRRAIEIGLDGMMVSICTLTEGSCWGEVEDMLEAANNIDPDFKIIPTLDVTSLKSGGYTPAQIAAAIASLATAPALMRMPDGRLVLFAAMPEGQTPAWWQSLRQELQNRGVDIYLTLIVLAYEQSVATYAPVAEAIGSWGTATPSAAEQQTAARVSSLAQLGKKYLAPVRLQDHRPRNSAYYEAANSGSLRASFKNAIDGNAEWLFLCTWNDGEEGTEFRPSTGIQWAAYDLSAYYLTWYKTGQAPTISRDVLYYFHRIEWTTSQPDPTKQPVPFELRSASQSPAQDQIELLAFLRSPGTLRIVTSALTKTLNAPAGVTSLSAPLASGYPKFALIRSGSTRVSLTSAFKVRDQIDWQDLLYRGGSSTRPVVDMVANPPVVVP